MRNTHEKIWREEVERFRVRSGPLMSLTIDGRNGAFVLPVGGHKLCVICSDGGGWDHVSVSVLTDPGRCPTWNEMCQIKACFWNDEEAVFQLHPAKADWINNHDSCLHLWKPQAEAFPLPPASMVGVQSLGIVRDPDVADALHYLLNHKKE